jgi:cytochrome b561
MNAQLRNSPTSYGLVAQCLHWLVVAGVLVQFTWAWRIDEAESVRQEFALVNQHKSVGMTVLVLVVLRLAWRAFDRPPAPVAGRPRFERVAASVTHWALYALVLAMPLSGWVYTSAAGYGAEFFGLLDIPDLVGSDERLEEIFGELHELLAGLLGGVALLHAAAALRHHFLLRDEVLRRMVPFWR